MARRFSTKTYGHDLGFSCAFRQFRATHSHCSLVHGYALSFKFIFEAADGVLDERNWVQDFGALKELKEILVSTFDHKVVVDPDDPMLDWFKNGSLLGALDLVVLRGGVGCEKFAEYAYNMAHNVIEKQHPDGRVRVVSCEVSEHGANSAIYLGD
jgi:6-pyruvoyltetrahydropterin/6-carboxytetrahydropterin synthase